MTGNGSGKYRTTPTLTMRSFDQLPPGLRDVLNTARFKWADQQILKLFTTRVGYGGDPALVTADLIATIVRSDSEAADQDAVRELRGFVKRARSA